MKSDEKKRRGLTRWGILAALGLFLVVVLTLGVARLDARQSPERLAANMPVFEVQRGPLTINLSEGGTIRPREQIIIKSEVEGQTLILYLIEEGTQVQRGDLLVELDASSLMDQRVNLQIQVINAEASYINARENLEVVKNQTQADIEKAELTLQFARQDLKQYEEGEFPKQLMEANARITLAQETLTNAQNSLIWSRKLYEEQYLSETELKRDELAAQKAQLDLELANEDLKLLKEFTYMRRIAELKSNLSQAEMALERVRRKAAADLAQAEAQLRAREAEFHQQEDRLTKNERQIEKTQIYAPMDGTVIYSTSTRTSWRGNEEPLSEGQTVRERQELIYLPTTVAFNAEIKVHESSLEKIRTGLPVRITVDALPGRTFGGRITNIAPLPDAQSIFMNPDLKVYNTTIEIQGNGADLRNGMSCRAEVIIDHYDDAVYVPIQAVMRVGGQPTVYVTDGRQYYPRPVKIGLDNNRMIHIIEGLKEGEKVILTPPLAAGETGGPQTLEEELSVMAQSASAELPDITGSLRLPSGADTTEGAGDSPRSGARRERRSDTTLPGEQPAGSGRMREMTPEQMEEARQRFQGISPEEREAMRARMQQMRETGTASEGRPERAPMQGGRGMGEMTPEQMEQMRQRFENMTPEEREAMRARFQQMRETGSQPERGMEQAPLQMQGGRGMGEMTPEQMEQMRQRFENMTPEEREAMRARMRQARENEIGSGGNP